MFRNYLKTAFRTLRKKRGVYGYKYIGAGPWPGHLPYDCAVRSR